MPSIENALDGEQMMRNKSLRETINYKECILKCMEKSLDKTLIAIPNIIHRESFQMKMTLVMGIFQRSMMMTKDTWKTKRKLIR